MSDKALLLKVFAGPCKEKCDGSWGEEKGEPKLINDLSAGSGRARTARGCTAVTRFLSQTHIFPIFLVLRRPLQLRGFTRCQVRTTKLYHARKIAREEYRISPLRGLHENVKTQVKDDRNSNSASPEVTCMCYVMRVQRD